MSNLKSVFHVWFISWWASEATRLSYSVSSVRFLLFLFINFNLLYVTKHQSKQYSLTVNLINTTHGSTPVVKIQEFIINLSRLHLCVCICGASSGLPVFSHSVPDVYCMLSKGLILGLLIHCILAIACQKSSRWELETSDFNRRS